MSKILLNCFCLASAISFSQWSLAQMSVSNSVSPIKARATLDVSSASIQRGYTLTKGPVLQPSFWVFSNSGLGAGVWGSMSLKDQSQTNPVFYEQKQGEFQKVDVFLYYKVPVSEAVKLEFLYAQYIYPEDNLLPNSTVRDSIVKFSMPIIMNPFVSVSYGLSDPIKRDIYMEAGVQQPVFQQGAHTITGMALSTYRNPAKTTATKQEGLGHSLVSLAYGYQGLKLAANYIIQGEKSVLATTKATEFSTTAGYTAWF